jgi:membrane fusion protein, multidrug efflux system
MTRIARVTVILAACVGAAIAVWQVVAHLQAPPVEVTKVPVTAVRAIRRDASTFLSNIATVQAFNTVLLRSRVDGQISKVAFVEGSEVKRGDVLVELDRRPFETQWRAAAAQKARDQAQLENAKRDLARYQSLVNDDAGAAQTLDGARAQVDQLSAVLNSDQAQIDFAALQLAFTTITAPIDGRTGARLVDVGNIVHANDTTGLVVLTQIRPIAVTFSLPQSALARVRSQQASRGLRVVALDAAGSKPLDEGKLTLIDNQIDPATGTFRCKAVFPNADETLWPGQFVMARVMLEPLANAVVIPTKAVQLGPHGSYVYLVGAQGEAEIRPIEVVQSWDGESVVSQGLASGEQVVLDGQFRLEAGVALEVSRPADTAAAR